MNKCCEFELAITGWKPGCISHNLLCKIEHCPEPVVLHVEAAFKVSVGGWLAVGPGYCPYKSFCLLKA